MILNQSGFDGPNIATTFRSALEGQSTSCAYVDLSNAYVDLTTAEGGDSIDINSSEDTTPEDENKDSSLNEPYPQ